MESRDGSGSWETVCAASCETDLPLDASYRVVDREGNALKGFRLQPNGADRLVVDVSPRSVAIDVLGIGGILGGSVLFIGGTANGSGGYALLGVLAGVGGIAALVANGTTVSQTEPNAPYPEERRRFSPPRGAFTSPIVSVTF